MKKIKFLSMIALASSLVAGCSCSKVDESTYESAVSAFKSTDAISFVRVETIITEGASTYDRKRVEASYIFDSNKKVDLMSYSLHETTEINSAGSGGGRSDIRNYYYDNSESTLYKYEKIGDSDAVGTRYTNTDYDSRFNSIKCDSNDCLFMVVGNLAPVYTLDEITEFNIQEDEDSAVVTYKGICPGYENCENNSQMIDYTIRINSDGNIESLSYNVVNGKTTHSIKYAFSAYTTNKVSITLPSEIKNYEEEK